MPRFLDIFQCFSCDLQSHPQPWRRCLPLAGLQHLHQQLSHHRQLFGITSKNDPSLRARERKQQVLEDNLENLHQKTLMNIVAKHGESSREHNSMHRAMPGMIRQETATWKACFRICAVAPAVAHLSEHFLYRSISFESWLRLPNSPACLFISPLVCRRKESSSLSCALPMRSQPGTHKGALVLRKQPSQQLIHDETSFLHILTTLIYFQEKRQSNLNLR